MVESAQTLPPPERKSKTDGQEGAAASKMWMLEERATSEGGRKKHPKKDPNVGSLCNASGQATAANGAEINCHVPHPSASNKPRRSPTLCEHPRVKSNCKDCGGSGIFEHQQMLSRCKDCGGSGPCSTCGGGREGTQKQERGVLLQQTSAESNRWGGGEGRGQELVKDSMQRMPTHMPSMRL